MVQIWNLGVNKYAKNMHAHNQADSSAQKQGDSSNWIFVPKKKRWKNAF
jgi:hypothetical protein